MLEYLLGVLILGLVWSILFIVRKDLRNPMVWGGLGYVIVLTVAFTPIVLFSFFGEIIDPLSIVPGYWNPNTLFDMGRATGGYAFEDVVFMFFVGGIATVLYETIFKKRMIVPKIHKHHLRAVFLALFVAGSFAFITQTNFIYALIVFGFAGAVAIWIERKDLIVHSIAGGVLFLFLYIFLFGIFTQFLFPDFVERVYTLVHTSGILIGGIPLEEFLYALSFGVFWAPLYEYEHQTKKVG